jgi:hypothetical protein
LRKTPQRNRNELSETTVNKRGGSGWRSEKNQKAYKLFTVFGTQEVAGTVRPIGRETVNRSFSEHRVSSPM